MTRFFLHWQHHLASETETGEEGIRAILEQLQGFAAAPELWEREIFRPRLRPYDGTFLRRMMQRGECFLVGGRQGRTSWILRGEGLLFLNGDEQPADELTKPSKEILHLLRTEGASFLSDLRDNTSYTLSALNRSLAELFWNGLITNDVMDEVANIKRYRAESDLPEERFEIVNPRRNPFKQKAMRGVRLAIKDVPGWNGRWMLVRSKSVLGAPVSLEEKIRRQAEQLLLRYGVVAREIAKREEQLLPWPMLAMELQRMEMRGEIRRGYFVEGLSGMQFALPDAVRMLDDIKANPGPNDPPTLLHSCDPANPYGTGVDLTSVAKLPVRLSRMTGNYLILDSGIPAAVIENYGNRIFLSDNTDIVAEGLRQWIRHLRSVHTDRSDIVLEYCNNQKPADSDASDLLRSVGFYRDKAQTMRLDLR